MDNRMHRFVPARWLLILGFLPTTASAASASAPASRPAPRVVEFQPGVRIDWTERQVVVQATVVLREGLIELFACSPHTREHEAVVRIEARPWYVFQAMGLVGLVPGRPFGYDARAQANHPAEGESLELDVRCT